MTSGDAISDLASYIQDIRTRHATGGREWYWKSNAHRPRVIAYALEYEPFTLLLKVGQYIRRRRALAPLTFSHRPAASLRTDSDFQLYRTGDSGSSYLIQTPQSAMPPPSATLTDSPLKLPSGHRKLIILHAYYEEEARAIFDRLDAFADYDLMLTTPVPAIRDRFIDRFDPTHSACFMLPNVGRDVLPFLLLLRFADLSGYQHFVKIHTKRSSHLQAGGKWFSSNVELLVGQKPMTDALLQLIDPSRPSIVGLDQRTLKDHLKNNRHWLQALTGKPAGAIHGSFIPGTMFAGTGAYLRALASQRLHLQPFEPENGQLDGCLIHALERYFGYFAKQNGGICATFEQIIASV